jgi:hypothetical protein
VLRRVGLICFLHRKLIRPILTSPPKKYKVAVEAALATGRDFNDWQGTVATSITNRVACDACHTHSIHIKPRRLSRPVHNALVSYRRWPSVDKAPVSDVQGIFMDSDSVGL